jgi:dephospho-CoA kinase
MKSKNIIGFVGLPASGKSTALETIKDLGTIVTMGDVVRNEVKKQGLEINSENLGNISKNLREIYGPMIIAKRCVELIQNLEERIVFVDGIRSMNEVILFRQFWTFPIIAILCPDKIRHQRMMERGRADDSVNIEKILERDKRELGFGLAEVLKLADYKINNISSAELLQNRTSKIILKILNEF